MTQSDIINAVLAGLTFLGIVVALCLGVWSVNETKKLQKKQHIEQLIRRITRWQMETRSVGTGGNVSSANEIEMAFKNAQSAKNTYFISAGRMFNELIELSDEGETLKLELGSLNKQLSSSIGKLSEKLISCAHYHDMYQDKFLHSKDDMLEVSKLANEWAEYDPIKEKEMREIRKDIKKQVVLLANNAFK
jgi:hypothetical protein